MKAVNLYKATLSNSNSLIDVDFRDFEERVSTLHGFFYTCSSMLEMLARIFFLYVYSRVALYIHIHISRSLHTSCQSFNKVKLS